MRRKLLWIIFVMLAILIGLYPAIYFAMDRKFGLLQSKSTVLLANIWWNLFFYTHIIFGGLCLLIGWSQFSARFRASNLALHRLVGKIYLFAALLSGVSGIYIGFFATGGWVASAGFIGLGMIWLYTTVTAFLSIKAGKVNAHQKLMIYSYAACFAAVTLRLWLPFLVLVFGDFISAYLLVSWLCWVPNIIVAYFMQQRIGPDAESPS